MIQSIDSSPYTIYLSAPRHDGGISDADTNLENGPSAATLDALPFGDDGARPILRRGGENDFDRILQMTKEAANSSEYPQGVPMIDRKDLSLGLGKDGYLMIADIGDRLPVGFALVTYRRSDVQTIPDLLGLSDEDKARSCQVESVIVRPKWRGKDLHLGLMSDLMHIAKLEGFRTVYACVAPDNAHYVQTLKEIGFTFHKRIDHPRYADQDIYHLVFKPRRTERERDAENLSRAETLVQTANDANGS